MKNLVLLSISVIMVSAALAQNPKCPYGVSTPVYHSNYNAIKLQTDTYQRLLLANKFVQSNCLNTFQIKQIAMLLHSDADRIEFCKLAFGNTIDQENFYDVYDAFAYFSNVFRLHDYVLQQKGAQWNTNPVQVSPYNFPTLPYPASASYIGITGCYAPLTDNDFNLHVAEIIKKTMEQDRMVYMNNLSANYCVTTTQVMKLSTLISTEKNRLDYLKLAYDRIYDRENYAQTQYCLSNDLLKKDLLSFLKTKLGSGVGDCFVTDDEFNTIKGTINKESFNNTRLTIAKGILESKKCFTALQIKQMVQLFSFESTKLDLAKFAYDYCTDKENYYIINDVLDYSSSKSELTNYIKTKK